MGAKEEDLYMIQKHAFSQGGTASKLEVYDKKNCTMVFMININSYMYGEMILGVFEIF